MKPEQSSASGDTSSRKRLQVAGVRVVLMAPLDQESPGSPQKVAFGSSPGEAMAGATAPAVFFGGSLAWAVAQVDDKRD
jgi:hypothetical protein